MQADQINWPTTIGNLGLFTGLGIPTKATHHLVRFFVFLPHALKIQKTVMQSVMQR